MLYLPFHPRSYPPSPVYIRYQDLLLTRTLRKSVRIRSHLSLIVHNKQTTRPLPPSFIYHQHFHLSNYSRSFPRYFASTTDTGTRCSTQKSPCSTTSYLPRLRLSVDWIIACHHIPGGRLSRVPAVNLRQPPDIIIASTPNSTIKKQHTSPTSTQAAAASQRSNCNHYNAVRKIDTRIDRAGQRCRCLPQKRRHKVLP